VKVVAFVLGILSICLVAGCLGTGDIAIQVRGNVVDRQSRPYERCEVSVYKGAAEEVLASEVVRDGNIDTWFNVRSLWKGVEVGVRCDGAIEDFRSARIGWGHQNPADLGRIELTRSEE
jgi:hypothetical protein